MHWDFVLHHLLPQTDEYPACSAGLEMSTCHHNSVNQCCVVAGHWCCTATQNLIDRGKLQVGVICC